MKKFVKGRWFPLMVAGVTLLVAFFLGFRITYAPELENSWEAISAVASWASVAVSAIAVWAAVQIPQKIAEQQNKIALVNSRLEILDKIEEIASNISMIHNMSIRKNYRINSDNLLSLLSFATLDEFNRNQNIINRYSIYFSKFREAVKEFSLLYANIMLNCYTLKKEKVSDAVLEEVRKSINEASTFIHSEEFQQLKNYMNDIVKLDK